MNLQKPPGGIEWTRCYGRKGYTANVVRGCTQGCRYRSPNGTLIRCYAKGLTDKFGMGDFRVITQSETVLDEILAHKEPAGIFLDSMSDLFGPEVEKGWIHRVLSVCKDMPQHIFFTLTKRPVRLLHFNFPPNVWVGLSAPADEMGGKEMTVEDQVKWFTMGLRCLTEVNARLKWLSLEPMIHDFTGPLADFRQAYQWVVIGALSDGSKKYDPPDNVLRRTLEVVWPKPVFFKSNMTRAVAQRVCGKWRQEFPPQPL